ncbi:Pycsar system effector family protein [Mucilaginibacter sp.]|jgi:predicted metal-dependent HD superfamily phosphohydrolase|uniref:Pycsar system effector family protein n=1 Tax=Mucilaginibacter sp. TaxID=1882438 RepID=UPI003561431E
MNEKQLLKRIREYVGSYYKKNENTGLIYHTLERVEYIVKAVKIIAEDSKVNKKCFFMLEAAAWFTDIGIIDNPDDYEESSIQIASSFLELENADEEVIATVERLMKGVKTAQSPEDQIEEILCDAVQYHLGKKCFFERCEKLRKEQAFIQNKASSKKEWLADTILFMESHHWHTEFCRAALGRGKEKNIGVLKDKLINLEMERIIVREHEAEKAGHEANKEKEKDRPEKGIETMFRITSSNNQRLSDMADNKAHILITVNSIILSAIISLVLRKLDADSFLAYPTFLLLAVSLVSMTFSILATRPSIPSGIYSQVDLDQKKINLLFFGNFYKMPLEDYTAGMMKVMDDRDFLYQTLIRDVYGQGAVLGKKYQLLRIAYSVFMFGLILAVLAFIIVSAFHHAQGVAPLVKRPPAAH